MIKGGEGRADLLEKGGESQKPWLTLFAPDLTCLPLFSGHFFFLFPLASQLHGLPAPAEAAPYEPLTASLQFIAPKALVQQSPRSKSKSPPGQRSHHRPKDSRRGLSFLSPLLSSFAIFVCAILFSPVRSFSFSLIYRK